MRHLNDTSRPALRGLGWVAGLAALLLTGAAMVMLLAPAISSGVPDMRGNLVAPLPGTVPGPAKLAAMRVVEQDGGQRFKVPDVGLDVPLGALDDVDGVITPPGFASAYSVRNHGVSLDHASEGTVYVVMHALMGAGMGPGNYLIDPERATSQVPVGATIDVAGTKYTVTGSTAINRNELPDQAEVWQNTPNRLIVITCLLTPGNNAPIDNMVITAIRQH